MINIFTKISLKLGEIFEKFWPLMLFALIGIGIFSIYWAGHSSSMPQLKKSSPAWKKHISGYTSGIVSKKSNIYIEFSSDAFSKDMVGKSAAPYVEITPAIKGDYSISGTREITIIPSSDLKQGQYYVVSIKGDRIEKFPEGIGDYEFLFQVIHQSMGVETEGLKISGEDNKQMEFKGLIRTADAEEPEKIESALRAEFKNKDLKIKWLHDSSGREHAFVITGINRSKENERMRVIWNGEDIGATEKDDMTIEVPAIDIFKVIDVKPIQGKEQYILVFFSDKLDSNQSMKGMARVNQKGHSTRIEGNTIKIYPKKRFLGKIAITLESGIRNFKGMRLKEKIEKTVVFTSQKPQVKFTGKGVILPDSERS